MVVNDVKNLENKTINNQCSRCGQCCSPFIPFTKKELKKVKQYVKDKHIEKKERHIDENSFDATCCFWDPQNKVCQVYEVRPFVCRHFICSDKDWIANREIYAKRSTYNSIYAQPMYLTTFDDEIYGDCEMLIRYLIDICPKDENGHVDDKTFIKLVKQVGRTDILAHMKLTLDTGEEIDGEKYI